jgi:hypothetical protein
MNLRGLNLQLSYHRTFILELVPGEVPYKHDEEARAQRVRDRITSFHSVAERVYILLYPRLETRVSRF